MIDRFGVNRFVAVVVAWVIAAVWAVFRMLDAPHSLLFAAVATAVIVAWPRYQADIPLLEPLPFRTHAGARSDLSHLSWIVLDRDGAVSPRAIARVRAVTEGRPSLDALRDTIDTTSHPTVTQVTKWIEIIKGAP